MINIQYLIDISDGYYLQLLEQTDTEPLFFLINKNMERLIYWFCWMDILDTMQTVSSFVTSLIEESKNDIGWTFLIKKNETPFGLVGFNRDNNNPLLGYINYWIDPSIEGRGIALKACQTLIYLLFKSKLKTMSIVCENINYRSQNIAKKLSFFQNESLHPPILSRGSYVSALQYSTNAASWNSRNKVEWYYCDDKKSQTFFSCSSRLASFKTLKKELYLSDHLIKYLIDANEANRGRESSKKNIISFNEY